MQDQTIQVSTTNKVIDPDNPVEIEVEFDVTVPSSLAEAADFYGGEEKLLTSIQQDVARRKGNLARPVLREAPTLLSQEEFTALAQSTAESYAGPGRKRSTTPEIQADELDSVESREDLIRLLTARGISVT